MNGQTIRAMVVIDTNGKERSTVVYLSGPMTNYPDLNAAAFEGARNLLRRGGYVVRCPSERGQDAVHEPRWVHMRRDFMDVLEADQVCVLPGWEKSIGSKAEVIVALESGKRVWRLDGGPDVSLDQLEVLVHA